MSESSDALRLMARDEDEAVRRVRLAFSGLASAAGEIDRLEDQLAQAERERDEARGLLRECDIFVPDTKKDLRRRLDARLRDTGE